MATDFNIPQFGVGVTPGINASRMQAIWTFLKAIGSGGAGSVVKADNALQVAATTPSDVGLLMLSAANKAAQQALVSGSGLDAGTVSGYGIGVNNLPNGGTGTGINATIKSGLYYCNDPVGVPAGGLWGLMVVPIRNDLIAQQIWAYSVPIRYTRYSLDSGATWQPWFQEWNAFSDGNGGQPPAPKGVFSQVEMTGSPDTVITFPDADGSYIFSCQMQGANTDYSGSVFIRSSGNSTGSWVLGTLTKGAEIAITLVGNALKVAGPATFQCYGYLTKLGPY